MNQYNDNYDIEISLKNMLLNILIRWRIVLVISFLFAIVLGSYKLYSGIQSFNDDAKRINQEKSYQDAMKGYEKNKEDLETEIRNITTRIEQQKVYNENSILMQIDPYNKIKATKGYYISTDYMIMPDMTYQNTDITDSIIQAYINTSVNGEMYDFILDQLSYDMDIRYLKELIDISADYNTNIIYVQVIHKDYEYCEEIYEYVISYFEQTNNMITKALGVHKITGIYEAIQSNIDTNLNNIQNNNILAVTNYENSLKEKQNALNALVVPINSVISKSVIVKSGIKYALVGCILGAFMTAAVLVSYYLISDKLLNERDLRPRYNMKILGFIENSQKKRLFEFVDRLIARMQGYGRNRISEEETIHRIAANLKAIYELNDLNKADIMITGTIEADQIKRIGELLAKDLKGTSYNIYSGANINYSACTIDQLKSCDAVVLVEKVGSSTYTEITRQLECIYDLGKNIIGAILLRDA